MTESNESKYKNWDPRTLLLIVIYEQKSKIDAINNINFNFKDG